MALPLEKGSAPWWRCYFRSSTLDIFDTIEKGFEVAAEDFPDEFYKRTVVIVEKVLSLTFGEDTQAAVASIRRLQSALSGTSSVPASRQQNAGPRRMEHDRDGKLSKREYKGLAVGGSCKSEAAARFAVPADEEKSTAVSTTTQMEAKSHGVAPECSSEYRVCASTAKHDDFNAKLTSVLPSQKRDVEQPKEARKRLVIRIRLPPKAGAAKATVDGIPMSQESASGTAETSPSNHSDKPQLLLSSARPVPEASTTNCSKKPLLSASAEKPVAEASRLTCSVKKHLLPSAKNPGSCRKLPVGVSDSVIASWDTATALEAVFGEDYEYDEHQTRLDNSKRKLRQGYEQEMERKRARTIQVIDPRDLPSSFEAKKKISQVGRRKPPVGATTFHFGVRTDRSKAPLKHRSLQQFSTRRF